VSLARISVVRDGMAFPVHPLSRDIAGETVIDYQVPAETCMQLRNLAIVLFEHHSIPLPFSHPLWWASICSFSVQGGVAQPAYTRPLHRFADPLLGLAFAPEELKKLDADQLSRFIGRLNADFTYPYLLASMELVQIKITHRLLKPEHIPEDGTVMVILDVIEQRLIV
jgi:hypothetical protein